MSQNKVEEESDWMGDLPRQFLCGCCCGRKERLPDQVK